MTSSYFPAPYSSEPSEISTTYIYIYIPVSFEPSEAYGATGTQSSKKGVVVAVVSRADTTKTASTTRYLIPWR